MIIETIFSTVDESGAPNFAPMGVTWGEDLVTVRPYRETRTCCNLLATGCGVANLTDDVLAYVQCGLYDALLPHFPAKGVRGIVFRDACAWLELDVVSRSGAGDRLDLQCRVLYKGKQKDFLGFCRARNAVIEAAILATRIRFCDRQVLNERLSHYGEIVDRTGSEREKEAFRLVCDYIREREAP